MRNFYKILSILFLGVLVTGGIILYKNKLWHTDSIIYSTTTLHVLDNLDLDENTLLVFDVDEVLIVKKDPWERGHRQERLQAETIKALHLSHSQLHALLDKQTKDRLWTLYMNQSQFIVVEPDTATIIQRLQRSGIKIIALTDFPVGNVGLIPSLEDWRINQLAAFGINFDTAIMVHEPIVFKQFTYDNKHPVFKQGILFTAAKAASKGQLLRAFLEHIHWRPNNVIFFDDKKNNVESVQKELQAMSIPFVGYEYNAVKQLPAFFDKEVAEFQMRYLIDHEQWLSGEQARSLMPHFLAHFKSGSQVLD